MFENYIYQMVAEETFPKLYTACMLYRWLY